MSIGAGCQRADEKKTGEQSPSMLSRETLSREGSGFLLQFPLWGLFTNGKLPCVDLHCGSARTLTPESKHRSVCLLFSHNCALLAFAVVLIKTFLCIIKKDDSSGWND